MPRSHLVVLALLAGCSSRPVVASPGGSGGTGGTGGTGGGSAVELCGDFIDDDGNGLADCADPACASDPHCPVCGDGLRQGAEVCDGEDLGNASCLSQHFNGGGRLRCTSQCALDTTGCSAHEDCGAPGDEDRNGLSDCADPACASLASCLTLEVVDPPDRPYVTGARTLVVKVTDGTGAAVGGRPVLLTAPPGAVAPQGSSLSDQDGLARFDIRMGRLPGPQTFVARLGEADVQVQAILEAIDLPVGYVHTVLNVDRVSGSDSAGPALAAHVGPVIDVAAARDQTLYVAEACRILAISPVGELSLVAGTGPCESADDGALARNAPISIADLSLDEPDHRLVFVDSFRGTVRALDLQAGTLSTLAGGGTGGDGGPALGAALQAKALALAPDGTMFVTDAGTRSLRRVAPDGVITTALSLNASCSGEKVVVTNFGQTPSVPLVDAGGRAFVAATVCGALVEDQRPNETTPGIVRLIAAGPGRSKASHVAGKAGGVIPTGKPSTRTLLEAVPRGAFDAAGNLLAVAGLRLLKIDSRTWSATTVASWTAPSFAGEGVSVQRASFHQPAAVAIGAGGDLYVADAADGTVRRVVGLGQDVASGPLSSILTLGDGSSADLEQKLPDPLTLTIENDATPVAGVPVEFEADDPGMAIYPGVATDDQGGAFRDVRVGMTPGAHEVRAYPLDIHGDAGGEVATFHVTATEPPVGNILSVTGADGPGAGALTFTELAGQVLPSTLVDFDPQLMSVAPDGAVFGVTRLHQILMITARGTVELAGGVPDDGSSADGDGGPAVAAHMHPLGLAASRENIYFVEGTQGQVRAIDRQTGLVSTFHDDSGYIWSIAADTDGSLLLTNDEGLVRIDPLTKDKTVLLPGNKDCAAGDSLRFGTHGLAAGTQGFAFSGQACKDGLEGEWIGFGDRSGIVHQLWSFYSPLVALSPQGEVVWEVGLEIGAMDPLTLVSRDIAGLSGHFGEDEPALQSTVTQVGGMGYDQAGHLFLATDQRIRIVW